MGEPVPRGTRVLGIYVDVTSGGYVFCLVKGTPSGRIIMESIEDGHPMRAMLQHLDTAGLKRMVTAIAPARDVA